MKTLKQIKPKVLMKAVCTISVIMILVALMVSLSYYFLGPVPTIALVGFYAALSLWLHYELNGAPLLEDYNPEEDTQTEEQNEKLQFSEYLLNKDKKPLPPYDVIEIIEPEMII